MDVGILEEKGSEIRDRYRLKLYAALQPIIILIVVSGDSQL